MLRDNEQSTFKPQWGPIRRTLEAALRPRLRVKIPEFVLGIGFAAATSSSSPELSALGVLFALHGLVVPESRGFNSVGIVQKVETSIADRTMYQVTVSNMFSGWERRTQVPFEAAVSFKPGDFVQLEETVPFVHRRISAEQFQSLQQPQNSQSVE